MAACAPIDAELARLISGGISISLASCGPAGVPNMARGTGCRVGSDGRALTVLLAATPAAALLDDVRRSGRVAVVFSQPSTHFTVQFKGSDARIVPLEADDPARAAEYVDRFVAELAALGYPGEVVRTMLQACPDDIVAIRFTLAAGYSQTPGPKAGEPLGGPP